MNDNKLFKELVDFFISKGYLLSPDVMENKDFNKDFLDVLNKSMLDKPLVISNDVIEGISKKNISSMDWIEFDKSRVLFEKGKYKKSYVVFKSLLNGEKLVENKELVETKEEKFIEVNSGSSVLLEKKENTEITNKYVVKIIKSYENNPKKWEVKDFTAYFKKRYDFLQNILQGRQELQNIISINRIKGKENRSKVSCIGLIYDKRETKNGNILVTLEDPTGFVDVIFKPEVKDVGDLCLDEVIAVKGQINRNAIYGESILFPNIPLNPQTKKSPDEVYAGVISDIHVGSMNFLEETFLYFIDWLNLKVGTDKEKSIAEKIKYLFIVGDLVAGNGVYPHQEGDLVIKDLRSQYIKLAEYLSLIRKDIKLIICPGNHDATRMAEPQPPLIKEFAQPLLELKNAIFVSSPSFINIHSSENFEGFDFLMYHGSSFHYYNNSVQRLLFADAKNHPSMTWKYLLRKRHLAPTHGSTVYVPNSTEDALLIDKLPDVVINGDVHKSDLDNYNGIMIISPSCWEKKSFIQERRGNEPDPGRVPFLNLKTREVLFVDFHNKK